MKPNWNNIIIVSLLLIIGALTGGWITYAIMKDRKPETTNIKNNDFNNKVRTSDDSTLIHLADSIGAIP